VNYSNINRRLDQFGSGGDEPPKIQIITQDYATGAWMPGDITPAPTGSNWSGLFCIKVAYDDKPFNFLNEREALNNG